MPLTSNKEPTIISISRQLQARKMSHLATRQPIRPSPSWDPGQQPLVGALQSTVGRSQPPPRPAISLLQMQQPSTSAVPQRQLVSEQVPEQRQLIIMLLS